MRRGSGGLSALARVAQGTNTGKTAFYLVDLEKNLTQFNTTNDLHFVAGGLPERATFISKSWGRARYLITTLITWAASDFVGKAFSNLRQPAGPRRNTTFRTPAGFMGSTGAKVPSVSAKRTARAKQRPLFWGGWAHLYRSNFFARRLLMPHERGDGNRGSGHKKSHRRGVTV